MSVINYAQYRAAIESLYTDTVTIWRYENVTDPVTGVDKKQLVKKYEDQPCRLSQRALSTVNQTEAQNEIMYETKLFIAPEPSIQQGDYLEVTRGDIKRKYVSGEPFPYRTHQEISIQRREWA